ncbi:hypothetical protein CFK38_16990 [Brachybacterium vulturis]|uniref:Mannosylglycerate hydrolase MGH1-like glycoside hydrolase domain-containing protein n=1 Tax=Brachybacterium vulturis TaxID=2017484 RepID=A0A291GSS6_9MICO|nr:hypothetical protein [Brachybacterium vulturis]ATG53024.1 hypothetical protein CFK38_16990 [Brachybacterium vulturis]
MPHPTVPLDGPSPDVSAIAPAIDLDAAPYSTRFSRLLVLSSEGMTTWAGRENPASSAPTGEGTADGRAPVHALTVLRSAYERRAADSIIADDLRMIVGSAPAAWEAGADGIRFTSGARLLVTDGDRIVVTGLQDGDVLELRPQLPAEETDAWTGSATLETQLTLEGLADVSLEDGQLRIQARGELALAWNAMPTDSVSVRDLVAQHDQVLGEWMARCPQVEPKRQAMTDLCWWVLGNNTLRLLGDEPGPVVVPSKLGYVGLWQWDAYFIALGLRHGDPDLARTQMDVALRHARADGQLPDVVHDHGVLDSSANLPPGDLENLRRLGSPTLAGEEVPLTKPPLTALTLDRLSHELGAEVIDTHLEAVLASQRWWFEFSDPGATGWPAYLHPYSSGLDDSPVFDDNAILRSPDLAAYLVGQDHLLARWLNERGRDDEASECHQRSDRLRLLLEESWDAERELFALPGENTEVTTRSILNLIALLIPELRADIRESLVAQITDPARFGGQWLLPTVARDDPDFSPERMWRGPIWVNTAWLVIQGLRVQGEDGLADRVTENVLDLVMHAGGPSEYFNPDAGRKARTATVLFGWSSALFVEMAVGRASEREPW